MRRWLIAPPLLVGLLASGCASSPTSEVVSLNEPPEGLTSYCGRFGPSEVEFAESDVACEDVGDFDDSSGVSFRQPIESDSELPFLGAAIFESPAPSFLFVFRDSASADPELMDADGVIVASGVHEVGDDHRVDVWLIPGGNDQTFTLSFDAEVVGVDYRSPSFAAIASFESFDTAIVLGRP